jgi:glutamate/tyrosine decarboxylase-like PLP-dependent enzyme
MASRTTQDLRNCGSVTDTTLPAPLSRAVDHARRFLPSLAERPLTTDASFGVLVTALGGPLPEAGADPAGVIDELASTASRGVLSTAGPRYFGFVTGGAYPVAVAADWLVATWDQNAALHVMSPAMSAIEAVTSRWILEVFDLPRDASVGFVTGAHTANVTALAAARDEVLRQHGWDVEARGLQGAPTVTVLAGAEAHASIAAATRMLGLGADTIVRIPSDEQGRIRADAVAPLLASFEGPRIVCAQAGNVNTGACDPFQAIAAVTRAHGAWLHVDGAFGLWAAASPAYRHLVNGVALADSWTTDAHKWLNVTYDSGIVIVAHPSAHRAAMSQSAAYLTPASNAERDGMDWTPEASRRGRVVPVYAVFRALGRAGLADLVDRCCRLASRMAGRLSEADGVRVLNDIVLNQVLVRFESDRGENITSAVIDGVQREGTCWCGPTGWQGQPAMRISVSNWSTTAADIDRSAKAILAVHAKIRSQSGA